jgi:hypothetical protein
MGGTTGEVTGSVDGSGVASLNKSLKPASQPE